jgi:hypothetical protein
MVQGIENLTRLRGTIVARRPHPELPEWDIVTVDTEHAEPVEGKANFFPGQSGDKADVAIRRALLGAANAGAKIYLRAKWTPNGLMAEPYPGRNDFKIE